MSELGLSVPPGFTITTEVCALFNKEKQVIHPSVWAEIEEGIRALEKDTGRRLGDSSRPLLVSVRSGAAISMPGTVYLRLGAFNLSLSCGCR